MYSVARLVMKRVRLSGDGGPEALEGPEAAMGLAEQKKYARMQLLGVIAVFGGIIGALRLGINIILVHSSCNMVYIYRPLPVEND